MIGSERDTYDIDKLIEYIQQDIQSASRFSRRTRQGTVSKNWLEGVITGLEFALAHALELQEND
jgi:hypothetical protein